MRERGGHIGWEREVTFELRVKRKNRSGRSISLEGRVNAKALKFVQKTGQ